MRIEQNNKYHMYQVDAEKMKALLEALGYSVTVCMNKKGAQMKKVIEEFAERKDHNDSAFVVG